MNHHDTLLAAFGVAFAFLVGVFAGMHLRVEK